jgi:ABC-type sugar transport system permease subunit
MKLGRMMMASGVFFRTGKYFRKKDNARIFLMLVPGLVVIGMFTFYPIIKMN